MNQFFKRVNLLLLWGLATIFYACQPEELIEQPTIQPSKNFVDLDQVKALVTTLEFPKISDMEIGHARTEGVETTFKEIEEVLEVPDESGNTAYYIINFKEDAFIMLSADDRLEPIRAYSYDKKFPFQADDLSTGLVNWLSQTSDMVYEARILDEEQTLQVAQTWEICDMQQTLMVMPIDDGDGCGGGGPTCESTYESVGPIMSTEWGQWNGYNNFAGIAGSCPGNPNSRPPTGCVATAVAQVMNHHAFPTHYNWAAMPDLTGSTETAWLMDEVGEAVNMNYTCTGSGAHMSDAAAALINDFGYGTAAYTGFNRDQVISDIRANRPVILSGYHTRDRDCFLFWCSYSHSDGHAWVADGFRKSVSYSEDCSYRYVYYYLHMNWGWSGSQNAFYRYDDWSPGNFNFQYKKEMIRVRR